MRCARYGLLLALLTAGCQGGAKPAGGGPPGAGGRAAAVQLTTLSPQTVVESSEYLATLSSRRAVEIHPQVSGPITQIFVKPGDRVQAGTAMMEVDPERDQAVLANLKAMLAQRQSALDLAKQNFDRAERLIKPGVISQQEYETARGNLNAAEADLRAVQAQIDAQRTQLTYDRVQAPFTGVVGDIPVKVGDAVTPATLLTTLNESNTLQAYVHVPLDRAASLTPDTVVQLLDDKGQVIAEQRVGFVSPQADPNTQTLLLRIDFANTGNLRAAQLVRARVVWSKHPGLLIPVNAVVRLSGATFAFVAEKTDKGEVAHQIPVELGHIQDNAYVVISGLSAGQQVVVSGVQNLADGMPIRPEAPPAAPDAGAPTR